MAAIVMGCVFGVVAIVAACIGLYCDGPEDIRMGKYSGFCVLIFLAASVALLMK